MPYLQSFCSQEERNVDRRVDQKTKISENRGAEKRSIKERLEINKRIIEKQQGKDDRGKGVDRADKMVKR